MSNQNKLPFVVWWIIWVMMMPGIFMYYFLLGNGPHAASGDSSANGLWLVGFLPAAISIVLRQAIIPRISHAKLAFNIFVIGMIIAEGSCFMGILVFPAHKLELVAASFLSILQFMPLFARRFYK